MDIEKIENLREIADEQVQCAKRYAFARELAGKAETSLNLLLAAKLPNIRAEKPNCGIDMAQLILCEDSMEAKSFYAEWKENEAVYKGLEKLLDARAAKLIMEQSIFKYIGHGEKFGC
jgi:hypothetical protein